MKTVVLIGSHIGYPMDRTPLGGGAMVALQLARHWAGRSGLRLAVLGSGSEPPCPGARYHRMATRAGAAGEPDLVRLSELGYARFCRDFSEAATRFIALRPEEFPPASTALVVNDISESPDLAALVRLGYRMTTLWHVDVVDFFNRLYLGGLVHPGRLTRAYGLWERAGLEKLLPGLLRLVFAKQKAAVDLSSLLVVPSRGMARTLAECYGEEVLERTRVIPWGMWEEEPRSPRGPGARQLRERFGIGPETRVLMTLSRISPEKGIDLLLSALARVEGSLGLDLCLLVCGEPAFMRGASCGRAVRRLASRLRRTRVFFPGYLSPAGKKAFFAIADLFVSPSRHESYGLTVVEAMRAGLPVLASDHYGVEEALAPGCGLTVSYRGQPPDRALAGGLADLLADKGRLRAMGRRAREAARRMDFSSSAQEVLSAALGALGRAGEKT
jgi:glycosyltransferase involved in cell wall biosynthesis